MWKVKQQQAAVESVAADLEDRQCAWCNAEAGIPQGNGSHGICERHGNEWLTAAKASLVERRERRASK